MPEVNESQQKAAFRPSPSLRLPFGLADVMAVSDPSRVLLPAASLHQPVHPAHFDRDEGSGLSVEEFNEMGPIDYILVEWPGRQPNGEVAPHLVDLVDRGLIRILDLAFIAKAEDGSIAGIEIADVGGEVTELAIFEGASSGLLSDEDLAEAGGALEPGTSAALLVFENTWAAPFASAMRRSGGQLVASGRIPVQAVLAALDAAEAREQ